MRPRGEIKELAKERLRAQRAPAILLPFVLSLMGMASSLIDQMFYMTSSVIGRIPYYIVFWAGWLVLSVMSVNMYGAYVKLYEGRRASVGELFTGLGTRFFRKLGGFLWMMLWIMIWSLPSIVVSTVLAYISGALVVTRNPWGGQIGFQLSGWYALLAILCFIPVIIKALSYYAVPYILGYHTEVKAIQTLRLSKRMTKGHRGKIFVMYLSFIGWAILGLLPIIVGIPFLFAPRMVGLGLLLLFLGILGSIALFIVVITPYMYTAYAGLFVELREHAIASGVIAREEFAMEEEPSIMAYPVYPVAPPIAAPIAAPPTEAPVEVAALVPVEETMADEAPLEEDFDEDSEDEDEVFEEYEEAYEDEEEDDLTEE